jgi:hypothetical protein
VRIRGTCHALFAHDVGYAVDLVRAQERLTDSRRSGAFRRPRRAPRIEGDLEPPVRVVRTTEPIDLGLARTSGAFEASLYEYGGTCVSYRIPVDGSLEDLVALSELLYDNERLLADSRTRVDELIDRLGDAVEKPHRSALVEDYVVFEIGKHDGALEEFWEARASVVARILRAEPEMLSESEVADAVAHRQSYGPDDLALVDWFAAVLVGDRMEDERFVLEFAAVALQQLRVLDHALDASVETAYEVLSRQRGFRSLELRSRSVRSIARMQVDAAVLYENVHNAVKLTGDQYLARLYQLASRRFHLSEWETGIERKLEILDGIYEKLVGLASTRRVEILEWIIIVLIAVSILMYFLPGY